MYEPNAARKVGVLDPGSTTGLIFVINGLIGLIAATTLLIEKINILIDPSYVPSCSFNPVLSCGSVMTTPEAAVFGFPNPILGVIAFAALACLGAAILAGAVMSRWIWLLAQTAATSGFVFVNWLVFQSLYDIGALCPYCMVVWVVTLIVFVHVTYVNVEEFRTKGPEWVQRGVDLFVRYRTLVIAAWLCAVVVMIGIRFWAYWKTLI